MRLWFNLFFFFTVPFVLSCKSWNVTKPLVWLARPPPGAPQFQDLPPCHLWCHATCTHRRKVGKAVSRQVRSKVRGLLCLLCLSSLNKTRLLPFNFHNKPTAGPPGSTLQTPRSSTQHPCALAKTCLRLGRAGPWPGPSVLVSLCPVCDRPVTGLPSEPPRLSSAPAHLPAGKRPSPDAGASSCLRLPTRVQVSSWFLSSAFAFSLSPYPSRGDLSGPFRCPRSSASVRQVLCGNCFTCRCLLDTFVGREKLHVLLLLHHLGKSPSPF